MDRQVSKAGTSSNRSSYDECDSHIPKLIKPHIPLDLSFRCIIAAGEIADEVYFNQQDDKHKPRDVKYVTNVLRLNNNSLSDLSDLDVILSRFLHEPILQLEWVDLSFNDLHSIDKVLTKFQNLRVLYLHGNQVEKLEEIDKLRFLPHLIKLTLHGNGLETEKGYRQYVLWTLPNLRSLDFSTVTKEDRLKCDIWRQNVWKSRGGKRSKMKARKD